MEEKNSWDVSREVQSHDGNMTFFMNLYIENDKETSPTQAVKKFFLLCDLFLAVC